MKTFCFIALMLFPWLIFSQSKPTYFDKLIGFNYWSIDTSNSDIRSITELWKNYLIRRVYGFADKIDTAGFIYWNDEEKQLYNDPDLILSADPYLSISQTNILSIKPIGQGFFKIMNVKGFVDDSSSRFKTQVIFYVLAKKVNDKFKLFNYFYLDKERLKVTNVKNVCYYYPSDYKFDNKNALNFTNFEDSLSNLFNCPIPKTLIYLVEKNPTYLMNHLGFIYDGGTGTGKHGGKFIFKDNMILSSINENHRHELVHYFTKIKNPDVIGFFDEGLATYFGGNLGNTFQWHLNYLNEYIKDKPDLILTDENKFGYIDAKTNPQYVLGAIIIKYTIDKFGFPKVLALLRYSKKQNTFSDVIEKELGIKKSELNNFFRNFISEYADK
ncbi:MAG: hypothetical protein ABSE72_02605 [Bacteroidales bacterium]